MRSLDTWDAVLAFVFAGSVAWMLVPAAEAIARTDRRDRLAQGAGPARRARRRSSEGWRSWSRVLGAGLIWLPWDAETRSILLGATAITALGVADDIFELPALPKLLGQIGAALIPVVLGRRARGRDHACRSSAATSSAGSPIR